MWISTASTNLIKEVTLSHTVGRKKSHSLADELMDKEDAPCAIFKSSLQEVEKVVLSIIGTISQQLGMMLL